MIKVKDEKGLARDPFSKAILRIDPQSLIEHRRKKMLMKKLHEDASKVSDLEKEVADLKNLVHQLIDKINTGVN